MNKLGDSLMFMENLVAKRGSHVLVAYSGGKDSRVVLDIASRTAKKVTAFFQYYIPDLECDKQRMQHLRDHYPGVELIEWCSEAMLKTLCDNRYRSASVFEGKDEVWDRLDFAEIAEYLRKLTKANFVVAGHRRNDFFYRKSQIKKNERNGLFAPIKDWNKSDVVEYLKVRKIPLPDIIGGLSTGSICTAAHSICWLHDHHPDDYEKFLQFFPFAEAVIQRRKFYNVPECEWTKEKTIKIRTARKRPVTVPEV
jgi:predicted phosphoadenosine phosphosulfate sulfurtransferase